jgi:hypothetical protein
VNFSTKPILIIRYRELNRRLQLSSVCERIRRIQILRKSIDGARQELRQLESVLLGRTAGAV